jgi:hypothetical protein
MRRGGRSTTYTRHNEKKAVGAIDNAVMVTYTNKLQKDLPEARTRSGLCLMSDYRLVVTEICVIVEYDLVRLRAERDHANTKQRYENETCNPIFKKQNLRRTNS